MAKCAKYPAICAQSRTIPRLASQPAKTLTSVDAMSSEEPAPQPNRQRNHRYALWVVVPAIFLIGFVMLGLSWPAALGIEILVCAGVFAWWLTDSQSQRDSPPVGAPPGSADQSQPQ